MKKELIAILSVLIIIAAVLINGCSKTSEPTESIINKHWTKLLGNVGDDYGQGIATDTVGNVYVTGYTTGDLDSNINTGGEDIVIAKYDKNGNKIWSKLLGGSTSYYGSSDYGNAIATDSAGNVYVTGYTTGDLDGNTNSGYIDIVLAKYDNNGNKIWTRLLGSEGYDEGRGIATDIYENIYITGYTDGNLDKQTNAGAEDIVIAKYDKNGNKIWIRLLGDVGYEEGHSIATYSTDNVYIVGGTYENLDGEINAGVKDIVIAKYDSNGNKKWTKLLGSAGYDEGYGITTDNAGNVYVTGFVRGNIEGQTNAGGKDIVIAKYNSNGDKIWVKLFGGSSDEEAYSVVTDSAGNVYVTGYTYGDLDGQTNDTDSKDIVIAKFDSNGNKLWTKLLGTPSDDSGRAIISDYYGNIYITGSTGGDLDGRLNSGGYDIFITKF